MNSIQSQSTLVNITPLVVTPEQARIILGLSVKVVYDLIRADTYCQLDERLDAVPEGCNHSGQEVKGFSRHSKQPFRRRPNV